MTTHTVGKYHKCVFIIHCIYSFFFFLKAYILMNEWGRIMVHEMKDTYFKNDKKFK